MWSLYLPLMLPCSRLWLSTRSYNLVGILTKGLFLTSQFVTELAYFFPDITEFCNRLAFDLNSSLLDTHISYPPCMRARIALSCYSSPERPDFYRLQACFVVQTDKPLISRDVIVETWTDSIWTNDMKDVKIYDDSGWSNQDEHVNLVLEHEYDENDEILELDSLANIIAELEIKHDCRAVFKPEHTVIYLDNNGNTHTGPFSLVPTEFDRRDVVDHDKEAYAALMVATAADIEEWEAR